MNKLNISLTRNIPNPNIYVKMLPDYAGWIYLEEEALEKRGHWAEVFENPSLPVDLEIGCGNGFFFENQVRAVAGVRNVLGIEIKYKPLVQTVRRVKKLALGNGRGIRFNARVVDQIFSPDEIHNVFIYFPDPWPKARQQKNRLLKADFWQKLSVLQKPGCWVDFKTDSEEYFDFAEKELMSSPYKTIRYSRHLHQSEWSSENFMTAFEKIFTRKGQPTFYMRLVNGK